MSHVDVMNPKTPDEVKMPEPYDTDLEKAAQGTILQYYGKASELMAGLETKYFYHEVHQIIFRVIRDIAHKHGASVSVDLVIAELKRLGHPELCDYVRALLEQYGRMMDMPQIVEKLRELWLLRESSDVGKSLYNRCQHSAGKPLETIMTHRDRMNELLDEALKGGEKVTLTVDQLAKEHGELQWLWPNWIPKGQLTLMVAEPGVGKSALSVHLSACVFGTDPWPDGTQPEGPAARTLYCDTEGNERQLLDRVRNWGLPAAALTVWGERPPFNLQDPECVLRAEHIVKEQKCSLLVVDTLRGGFDGDENSSELGRMLRPWTEMARRTNVALLVVHHERKRQKGARTGGLDCVRGSSALVAAAKSVIHLGHADRTEGRVRVELIKHNYAPAPPDTLVMTQHDDGLRFAINDRPAQEPLQAEKAQALLLDALTGGEGDQAEILALAAEQGIGKSTIYRASNELGVIKREVAGDDGERRYMWALPTVPAAGGETAD